MAPRDEPALLASREEDWTYDDLLTMRQEHKAAWTAALLGEIGTRDALRQSAEGVNAAFANRPKDWQ